MRLFPVCATLVGTLSIVQAQTDTSLLAELPQCALTCLFAYLPDTKCSTTDFACLCAAPTLWTDTASCILPSCTVKEVFTAKNVSAQICLAPVRDKTLEATLVGPLLCSLALIFVIIRVVARKFFVSNFLGWDDGLILLSTIVAIPIAVTHVYFGRNGLGKDIWTLPFDHITTLLRILFVGEFFYLVSTTLTKISILAFYLRIFPSYRFGLVTKGLMVATSGLCIGMVFVLIFQCWPISYVWTRWSGETKGRCVDLHVAGLAHAGINMVLDLAILVLPLPSLWKVQINYSWSKKLRLMLMFSVGLIVTVVSALRLQALGMADQTQNFTWEYRLPLIWGTVEVTVGIICACLPASKVFFARMVPRWLGFTTPSSGSGAPSAPGVPGQGSTWTASTATASKNRPSNVPRTTSAIITALQEEGDRERGDFVQLVDVESNKSKSSVGF